jgi:hypothetical protein
LNYLAGKKTPLFDHLIGAQRIDGGSVIRKLSHSASSPRVGVGRHRLRRAN